MASYKIMVFTWNTESICLSETMDQNVAAYNRSSANEYMEGFTTWKYKCEIPDFFYKLKQFINDHNPDLIVIGFQEDRYPGSYFHSHLLPSEMPKLGYGLVKRTKLMGVGVTSYNGLFRGDLFVRGIRVSIYAKAHLVSIIERSEHEMRGQIGNYGQSEYICYPNITRGKGATVSYVILPGFARLAFVCCHLPINAESLINERLTNNRMMRQTEINHTNYCFNNIVENLILAYPAPTYVIYFGDFNYRLADPRPASEVATDLISFKNKPEYLREMYQKYDELREQMRRLNIYEFFEGVDNQGPNFLPTCKMSKQRNNSSSIIPKSHFNSVNISDAELIRENPKTNHLSVSNNFLLDFGSSSFNNIDSSSSLTLTELDSTLPSGASHFKSTSYTRQKQESMSHFNSVISSVPSHFRMNGDSVNEVLESETYELEAQWKLGREDHRVPSWCDRILYQIYNNGPNSLKCTYYERFDYGSTMAKSDHAAVIGIFQLQN